MQRVVRLDVAVARLATALAVALCSAVPAGSAQAQGDPIPGYLSQLTTETMRRWATVLVEDFGPRRADTFDHFVDGACTWSGTPYPRPTIELASDYVRAELEAMGYSVVMEHVPDGSGSWGHNVYATKTGSVHPDVFIEYGAHLDTQPWTPGGNDNASGCVSVLELARVLKPYPNRHSIRFAFWVAEEITVPPPGSYHHVAQALARGERIKAGLNIDSTGWPDAPVDGLPRYMNEVWYNDAESERIDDLFQTLSARYGIDIGFRKTPATITSDERAYWLQPDPQTAVTSVGGWSTYHPAFHACGDTVANIDFVNVLRTTQQNLAVGLTLDAEVIPPTVTLTLQPGSLPADGSSTATALVRLTDAGGAAMPGQTVTLTTSGDVVIGAIADHGDGTYTASLTASVTPGDETITATAGGVSASAVLDEAAFCRGTCFVDTTVADFGEGVVGGGYLAQTADGEVMLAPALGAEFSGATLPAGFVTSPYPGPGGSYSVKDGHVSLDGLFLASQGEWAAGRSVEFAATFSSGNPFQMGGFYRYPNGNGPWAAFDLGAAGAALQATTNPGTGATVTPTPGVPTGTPHRFRIDWSGSAVDYWVDGVRVATGHPGVPSDMPLVLADYQPGGGPNVIVDWVRMSPYAPTGTFRSRVFDARGPVSWGAISWTASTPSGTSVALGVRTGSTPAPDSGWTAFAPVGNGASIGVEARYLQYEATFTTSSPDVSPALEDVFIGYVSTLPPALSLSDTAASDFGAGELGQGSYLAETADGEVILAPTLGLEFFGTELPRDWAVLQYYGPGGTATVADGDVLLDGVLLGSPTRFGPGRVLEFSATYSPGNPYQAVAFWSYFASPWSGLDLGGGGAALQAGSSAGPSAIAGDRIGRPHRYRVDWTAGGFAYLVDGERVAATPAIATPMPLVLADYQTGGGPGLRVDWLRMSPYASAGTFTSRVLDAGEEVAWEAASWTASAPEGTAVEVLVRTGATADPEDGTWTPFVAVSNGGRLSAQTRYLQYRAVLSTADPDATPALEDFTVTYRPAPPPSLAVTLAGAGSGAVVSSPAGIACGEACSFTFGEPTPVTLTATPAVGSRFIGWSGDCAGEGTCSVLVDSPRAVVATFALESYELAVSLAGTGRGSVAADGLACAGGSCSGIYTYGTAVRLEASPAPGSAFAGWGGACSGTAPCVVTVAGATSVTATFVDATPPVIAGVAVSPAILWPANGKLVGVEVDAAATDDGAAAVSCAVTGISSNETSKLPQWRIVDAKRIELLAERSGKGAGRVYAVTVTCSDAAGNEATASATVAVPHDQGW